MRIYRVKEKKKDGAVTFHVYKKGRFFDLIVSSYSDKFEALETANMLQCHEYKWRGV